MILLARHGRTASNAAGLLLGRADPDLDELGRGQAMQLGEAIAAGGSVDLVLTSPLARTRQTAAAVAAATGATVEVDDRLVELDYGDWDQRPLSEIASEEWARWRRDIDFAPPGGESLRQVGARVAAAMEDLASTAQDATVVAVSHVSPIKAAVAWALGGDDAMAWRMFVAPASLTRIAVTGGGPSLHAFNECAHLRPPSHEG